MNLQVIKSRVSIAQNFVVSASALGAILPEIRNLAIACICYASVNIKVLEIVRYSEHTCNYFAISDSCFSGKIYGQLTGQKRAEYVLILRNPGCESP